MVESSVAVMLLFHDKDEQEKEIIKKHLAVMQRHGKIELWEKGLVLAGQNTEQMIQGELDKAEIALFLVSIESVASDQIWREEVERSLKRHQHGELIFIPVIVRDCQWEETLLAKFKPLPEGGKPISQWSHIDEPCKQVADTVKQHVKNISRQKQVEPKQQGIVPPEFQEVDTIFKKMPDERVMNHILFSDREGKPASAIHFSIYAEMLKDLRSRMSEREEYNFYFGNLEDAKIVEDIARSIRERADLLKIDIISLGKISRELQDASRKFRLDFGSPENANLGKWHLAKTKHVDPFCNVILRTEKKLDTLSGFSIVIDLSNLSPN